MEDQCYPYTSGDTRDKGTCKYVEEIICPNGKPAHVHQTTPAYRIAQDEKQIMKEIKTQGPVQAIITVGISLQPTIIIAVSQILCPTSRCSSHEINYLSGLSRLLSV